MSNAAATTTNTATVALAEAYRLQQVKVQTNPEEEPFTWQAVDDPASVTTDPFRATIHVVTDAPPCGDDNKAETWEVSLKLANRMRARFCVTPVPPPPQNTGPGAHDYYSATIQGAGVMSTRMMALDPVVQQLERVWSQALPRVTQIVVHEHDKSSSQVQLQSLSAEADSQQIVVDITLTALSPVQQDQPGDA